MSAERPNKFPTSHLRIIGCKCIPPFIRNKFLSTHLKICSPNKFLLPNYQRKPNVISLPHLGEGYRVVLSRCIPFDGFKDGRRGERKPFRSHFFRPGSSECLDKIRGWGGHTLQWCLHKYRLGISRFRKPTQRLHLRRGGCLHVLKGQLFQLLPDGKIYQEMVLGFKYRL